MYNIPISTGFLMAPVHSVSIGISFPGPFSAMEPGRMFLTVKPDSNHFSGIPRSTGSNLNCYSPERSIKEDFSG